MKTDDLISAAELKAIIEQHGPGTISVEGDWPESYEGAEDLGLESHDQFRVVINYGHEVQFHLVDGQNVIITTGLTGRCEGLEWIA